MTKQEFVELKTIEINNAVFIDHLQEDMLMSICEEYRILFTEKPS